MRSEVQIFPDPPIFRVSFIHCHTIEVCNRPDVARNVAKERQELQGAVRGLQAVVARYFAWSDAFILDFQRVFRYVARLGAIAQLGERLFCTQEVGGSIPPGSTRMLVSPVAPRAAGFVL